MKTYLVGGAVRDKMLGIIPKDSDWLIVGATALDVQSMLSTGYEQVGADFPVFLHPTTKDEYALARIERKTGVGYHGFEVDSSSDVTIEEDLGRRDLTINSMAMADDGELIDPYGGRSDLLNQVLRHTAAAFAEDPLRVLRLARFAARFPKFSIDPSTIALCQFISKSGELNHLAVERVWVEVEKGLCEASPVIFMRALAELGVLQHCDVLRNAFGSACTPMIESICKILPIIAVEERMIVGVAALAKWEGARLPGASKRLTDLYSHLFEFRRTEHTAESLAFVIKRAGGLREGPAFRDLLNAVTVLELAGCKRMFSFNSRELREGAALIGSVKASSFPLLTGKELGLAIDKRRITELQQGMSIPESTEETQQH